LPFLRAGEELEEGWIEGGYRVKSGRIVGSGLGDIDLYASDVDKLDEVLISSIQGKLFLEVTFSHLAVNFIM